MRRAKANVFSGLSDCILVNVSFTLLLVVQKHQSPNVASELGKTDNEDAKSVHRFGVDRKQSNRLREPHPSGGHAEPISDGQRVQRIDGDNGGGGCGGAGGHSTSEVGGRIERRADCEREIGIDRN